MKDLASTISESIKIFGQGFILAYYFPLFLIVLVHIYILIPIWKGSLVDFTSPNGLIFLSIGSIDMASTLGLLIIPIFLGIFFIGINDTLIYLFEGRYDWQKKWLLQPFMRRNLKQRDRLYSQLFSLQEEYRRVAALVGSELEPDKLNTLHIQLTGLAQQINNEHKKIENSEDKQTLPHNPSRVLPTAFGNAYAVAEEYSYERYGIDSVLFWPRLLELMGKESLEITKRINNTKTHLDLRLNLTTVFGCIFLEALLTYIISSSGKSYLIIYLVVSCGMLSFLFYKASVEAVQTLGMFIMTSYDLYRGLILKSFDIEKPQDILSEQTIWIKLASFIRRGDAFYFPTTWLSLKEEEDN